MHHHSSSQSANQITWKAVITGALILLMLIPAMLVYNLVQERKQRQQEVIQEVSDNWGQAQTFAAPYLSIPYTKNMIKDKVNTTVSRQYILLPETLDINGQLLPEEKKRSIFTVNLYTANLVAKGNFNLAHIKLEAGETLQWDKAKICFGLSDLRGIHSNPNIQINGQSLLMEGALPEYAVLGSGAAANIVLNPGNYTVPFEFPISFKGSNKIEFLPLGKSTSVNVQSTWKTPSFFGAPLPQSNIDNGFTADWQVSSINRGFPQVWDNTLYKTADHAFGLSLFTSADHYTQVERSIKYAILMIGLTFGFFFIMEILIAKRVHPVQYILVGIALVVFYSLLLSLGEQTSFGTAYFIASAATILLIVLYCRNLFRSWRNAIMAGILLTVLYLFVYFIIQLEDLNLLAGSVGLFILVAAAMYLTRKIDWYKEKEEKPRFAPPASTDPNSLDIQD